MEFDVAGDASPAALDRALEAQHFLDDDAATMAPAPHSSSAGCEHAQHQVADQTARRFVAAEQQADAHRHQLFVA